MRSHKQLDANRKNAKSSTGPKTQTGEKHARLNALKHGFYAKEIIINQKYRADVEKILGDYYAEKMPRTALQRVAVKEIAFCSWTCELAARLTVHHFNTLLEPDGEPEPPTATKETPEVVEFFGSSRQALRNGIAFLDRLRLEVEEHGDVPEDLKDSVRTVFGERFLELLKQPQSEVSRDGLLLAHQLHSHAKIFNRPLPSPPREGREFMVDPEQSKQSILKLIGQQQGFLATLREIDGRALWSAAQAGVSDDPLRYFASATRALHRAVEWYQYLVANDL